VRELPSDVITTLHSLAKESVWALANKDERSKRIFDSFDQFSKGVIHYHGISEQAYLAARLLT